MLIVLDDRLSYQVGRRYEIIQDHMGTDFSESQQPTYLISNTVQSPVRVSEEIHG